MSKAWSQWSNGRTICFLSLSSDLGKVCSGLICFRAVLRSLEPRISIPGVVVSADVDHVAACIFCYKGIIYFTVNFESFDVLHITEFCCIPNIGNRWERVFMCREKQVNFFEPRMLTCTT